jgi:hypothetical protein
MPSGPGADSLQELRALANSSTEISSSKSCLLFSFNFGQLKVTFRRGLRFNQIFNLALKWPYNQNLLGTFDSLKSSRFRSLR